MARRGESGFTLIEVIVALVLVSFVLTTILSSALIIKAKRKKSEDRDRAIALASELINRQRVRPAEQLVQEGKEGRLRWQLSETELARDPRGFFVLDRIEASFTDRDGKPVFFAATRTLKPIASN